MTRACAHKSLCVCVFLWGEGVIEVCLVANYAWRRHLFPAGIHYVHIEDLCAGALRPHYDLVVVYKAQLKGHFLGILIFLFFAESTGSEVLKLALKRASRHLSTKTGIETKKEIKA